MYSSKLFEDILQYNFPKKGYTPKLNTELPIKREKLIIENGRVGIQ